LRRDGDDRLALEVDHPVERDLCGRGVVARGELLERGDQRARLLETAAQPHAAQRRLALQERRIFVIFAGEQAVGQRGVGDDRHAQLSGGVEHAAGLDAAVEQL
jgi:hypothetical protein